MVTDEIRTTEREIEQVRDVVLLAWEAGGARGLLVWVLASAYLAGARARLWLLRNGWYR